MKTIQIELTRQELEAAEYAINECILHCFDNDREDFERLNKHIHTLLIKVQDLVLNQNNDDTDAITHTVD